MCSKEKNKVKKKEDWREGLVGCRMHEEEETGKKSI